jgi:GATA-binding protein, other eukaryote
MTAEQARKAAQKPLIMEGCPPIPHPDTVKDESEYAPFLDHPIAKEIVAPFVENLRRKAQLREMREREAANGHVDGSHSPVSRTATPSMYNPTMNPFKVMDESQFQGSSFQTFGTGGASAGRPTSPVNGDRHLDIPQTHEQLIAANSSLKTRVSELEVINDLFRTRLAQLEQEEASARRARELSDQAEKQTRSQLEANKQTESQLRAQLEDSHRRENNLKRRLDELELELKEARESHDATDSGRSAKRPRVEEPAEEDPEASVEKLSA